MSVSDPYAAKGVGEPELESTVEAAGPGLEAVPAGTAAEILDWVGEDQERAQRALDAEEAGNKRKTLITKLRGIIG